MTQLTVIFLFIVLLVHFLCFALGAEVGTADKSKTASQQQDPKCMQPMEPGPCRMNLDRFYYNSKTNKCEQFKFGGCRGNDNKFGFLKTCEDACMKSGSRATSAPSTASSSSSIVRTTTARAHASALSSTTKTSVNSNKLN